MTITSMPTFASGLAAMEAKGLVHPVFAPAAAGAVCAVSAMYSSRISGCMQIDAKSHPRSFSGQVAGRHSSGSKSWA